MNILITGGAGYIGSVLTPFLIEKGYNVSVLDSFFFENEDSEALNGCENIYKDDIRTVPKAIFKNIDVVIHLAAISQPDPTGKLDPDLFREINYEGTKRIAELAKKEGIKRFIFASTCSVYGSQGELLHENSEPNPLEIYGKTKLKAEKALLKLGNVKFLPTICRFATVYGYSPKMRFDLVVNGMTWFLYKHNKIKVMRDGSQWRPNVHVKDVAIAIGRIIETENEIIDKEIFNIGSNEQNYKILDLAKKIGNTLSNHYETEWYGEEDTRSYKVDFEKLKTELGFKTKYSIKEGAQEIYNQLKSKYISRRRNTLVISWLKAISECLTKKK